MGFAYKIADAGAVYAPTPTLKGEKHKNTFPQLPLGLRLYFSNHYLDIRRKQGRKPQKLPARPFRRGCYGYLKKQTKTKKYRTDFGNPIIILNYATVKFHAAKARLHP
ncbi:MAG: hypothetical protein JWQ09_142 [Segetibacter sp.]|nr:hypothetical protein [Segetibacter sp.]